MDGRPQRGNDARPIAREGVVSLIERALDVLRMAHGLAPLLQFLLLAVRQVGTRQLVVLELQEVRVLAVTLDVLLQLLQLPLSVAIGLERLLIVLQLTAVARNDIDYRQLEVLLVEQQVLVLGVYVDQAFTQFLEHREGYGGVVDEGTALT